MLVVVDDGGVELDRPRLPVDVGSLGVRDVPVGAAVEPDVELERLHEVDDWSYEVLGDRSLLEGVHVPVDDDAAVEGGNGSLQVEGLDQHLHAPGRAAARDGEEDAGIVQPVDGVDGGLREHLVLGDEGPVHVRQEQADGLGVGLSSGVAAMGRW